MPQNERLFLNWEQPEEERISSLESLWKKNSLLDVTLAGDDDQIEAHKIILSSASPVFERFLSRSHDKHPIIYLKGAKKKELKALLEFIYSGKTEIAHEDLKCLMELAGSLEIKGLTAKVPIKEELDQEDANENAQKPEETIIETEDVFIRFSNKDITEKSSDRSGWELSTTDEDMNSENSIHLENDDVVNIQSLQQKVGFYPK